MNVGDFLPAVNDAIPQPAGRKGQTLPGAPHGLWSVPSPSEGGSRLRFPRSPRFAVDFVGGFMNGVGALLRAISPRRRRVLERCAGTLDRQRVVQAGTAQSRRFSKASQTLSRHGVIGPRALDLPQQVGPAALPSPVEVAEGGRLNLLGPVPPAQEISQTFDPVLPPGSRRRAPPLPRIRARMLPSHPGPPGHPAYDPHQGSHAQGDARFADTTGCGRAAYQVDPQPLFPQEIRGCPALFRRCGRWVDNCPAQSIIPSPRASNGQTGAEASSAPWAGRLPVGFGLDGAGIPLGPPALAFPSSV